MTRLLHYAGWPAATGALLALLALLLFPQLRGASTATTGAQSFSLNGLSPLGSQWEGPVSYADAVQRASPAVVSILTYKELKRSRHPLSDDPLFRLFFNQSDIPQQTRMQAALGSGVIVSANGYLLTNNHVISGAEDITVLLRDGREAQASLVGTDTDSDLAVLKIDLADLTTINFGNPAAARVGDVVLAIGNPFGVGQTVTQGIISATGRDGANLNLDTLESNFIQTDAAINPGNSGGALIDAYGNLLGINTAVHSQRGANSVGIGFAIPAGTAMKVLDDIIEFGHVVRGWLGIETRQLTPRLARSFNLTYTEGIIITAIFNNGPAHLAGLLPGDVITHINEMPVGDGRQGMLQITQSRPGASVDIEVLRNGVTQTIEAVIGTKPVRQIPVRPVAG
ncbi:PDZ domain-containing protein [Exilibacterium tricleocarpae]|uniref:PDZ domain-containing protein n=1 Tax=Exilibacterium tricleocarpae TaxID=2591008 RepID=A0A545TSI8_9GAMM|nr:PDZ domain-containing protein [Exilibacterium tricleocarpae]